MGSVSSIGTASLDNPLFEPSLNEVQSYASYLGLDVDNELHLMWIADEALNAPLPSEWTEHHDSADRVFYYNVQTHASSWTHPLEQLHRDTYKCIVNFRSGDLSKEERGQELEKLRRKCEEAEREAHRELQAWSEHTDEQGQKFYYNREHQRSVWTDPRPARCHALYLQMKALRVLSKQLGQPAPTPHRGLEPLSVDHRGASDSERSDREGLLPSHGRSRKEPRGGLDAFEGSDLSPGRLDVSSWGNGGALDEDSGDQGRKRGGRKKRHRGGALDAEASARQDRAPPAALGPLGQVKHDAPHAQSRGALGALPDPAGDMKSSLLDMKKPSLSAVEEVRQAVGLSGAATRLPPMGALGQSNPFGRGVGLAEPPPGDGLSTVGRAKVRAGIRLDPLQ
jgi:hypothetical protein